jgi:hypothetical protein
MYHRSKKQRQAWLKTLEGKQWLADKIAENMVNKSLVRRLRAMAEMNESGECYDCALCVHNISHSCTWNLKKGCRDYFPMKSET